MPGEETKGVFFGSNRTGFAEYNLHRLEILSPWVNQN